MNGNSGAMSPVSVDGSEWSGINQYQKSEPPFSPTFSNRSNLATPPTSGIPSGSLGPNGVNGNNGAAGGGGGGGASNGGGLAMANGSSDRLSDSGNPSPPSSVAGGGARSSNGTLAADKRGRRYKQMEEVLIHHYTALRRFLHSPYRDDRSSKANKARDKLLRLSPTQFHELSTDVYDELLRRQQAMPSPGRSPRPDIPPFLPPRDDFHEKRNQARQKLASLQHQRFRDLATDVFCELERRFPQFAERESRRASPAPSFRGRPSNGYGPPNGYPPPPRSQSRGPPSRMGRGYPSGGSASPMSSGFPPRQASLGGTPPGMDSAPLPKSFQSNTIVPNKSTMVEDDDDAGTEDDFDARSDAFGLDAVLSRRDTATTFGDGDRKALTDAQAQASALQEKVDKLEELVRSKDEELSKHQDGQDKSQASSSEREEWEGLKSELEGKVSQAVDLNSSLKLELEKVRTEQNSMEQDLRNQLEASRNGGSGGDSDMQARFTDLEIKHQTLQTELQGQQQVTEEVRREASTFLMEMRTLSEQSHSNWEREEKLSHDVHRLEEEVKQWKSRYAKAKTQLRHLRASSVGIPDSRPDVSSSVARDHELMQEHGLIKDVHVTRFQISIDELLRIARYDEHRLVMQQIKTVVISVRYILQDVQMAPEPEEVAARQLRGKATRKLSATANNLITASKNFANSSGLSPVSLLDAAASHLSTAVIEIVHLVKIRASPADELEDVDVDVEEDDINMSQLKSPDYFSVAPSQRRSSNNESIYSAIHPPSEHSRGRSVSNTISNTISDNYGAPSEMPPNEPPVYEQSNGLAGDEPNQFPADEQPNQLPVDEQPPTETRFNYAVNGAHELQEVKLYVEDQTEGLVQSIQALVASIRAEEGLAMINTHLSAISTVVTNVSSSTEHIMYKPDVNPALRERSGPIIQTLDENRGRLIDTAKDGETATSPQKLREVTNKLPPIAFEIARETKELGRQLNSVQYDEDEEDDFR